MSHALSSTRSPSSPARRPSFLILQLALALGLLAYASGAIFVRMAIAAEPQHSLGFSLFLAAARMLLTAMLCLPNWRGFKLTQQPPSELRYSVFAGICLALYFATWMTSLGLTSIAASTTLVNLNPLWVILFSWMYYCRRPNGQTLRGIGLAVAGAIITSAGVTSGTLIAESAHVGLGNSLALLGSVAIALYLCLGHQAQQSTLSFRHHLALMYSTAAIVLMPAPLLLGMSYWNHAWQTYGAILMMALVTQLLGHGCINWVGKWLSPTVVSILLLTEPLIASVLGYLCFAEIPSQSLVVGGIVVIGGLAIAICGQYQSHRSSAVTAPRYEDSTSAIAVSK